MRNSLQELCLEIAGHAEHNRYSVLAYLLEVAAAEAKRSVPLSHAVDSSLSFGTRPGPIGVWDWDISNNANYLNAVAGEFFGKDPDVAARGLPQSEYLDLVHPDDVDGFVRTLIESVRVGGTFTYDYRIVLNDRSRWVRSEGNCALDSSGRPTRALGSLIDITALKEADALRTGLAPS